MELTWLQCHREHGGHFLLGFSFVLQGCPSIARRVSEQGLGPGMHGMHGMPMPGENSRMPSVDLAGQSRSPDISACTQDGASHPRFKDSEKAVELFRYLDPDRGGEREPCSCGLWGGNSHLMGTRHHAMSRSCFCAQICRIHFLGRVAGHGYPPQGTVSRTA